MAYNTLVRPQVEYASAVWSPYTQHNIKKVEMVQRRAIRWVKSNYSTYDSVTQMQDSLGWRSLELRRADARLAMFYKIENGLVASPYQTTLSTPENDTPHAPTVIPPSTYFCKLLQIHILPSHCCAVEQVTRQSCHTS